MNNNVKSATVAGLLGIFLGSVGAHDWYLGDKRKGTIHVCLAASGLIVSFIVSTILPSVLSWYTLISLAWLITILNAVAGLVMMGNGIWGLIEGIQILTQGDAGLAQKGYTVAQPNTNYGNNNYGNQPMNNANGNNINSNFGNNSRQTNNNGGLNNNTYNGRNQNGQ